MIGGEPGLRTAGLGHCLLRRSLGHDPMAASLRDRDVLFLISRTPVFAGLFSAPGHWSRCRRRPAHTRQKGKTPMSKRTSLRQGLIF